MIKLENHCNINYSALTINNNKNNNNNYIKYRVRICIYFEYSNLFLDSLYFILTIKLYRY